MDDIPFHTHNGSDSPVIDQGANTPSNIQIALTAADAVKAGDVCYINSSGKAKLAKADAIANASGLVMATASIASGSAGIFLVFGTLTSANISITAGAFVYLSTTGTTGNTLTATAPSGTNNVIQILGWGINSTTIFFNPSLVQVEHT